MNKQIFSAMALGACAIATASIAIPVFAQGQNKTTVERPSGGIACPSGWRTVDSDTSLCEPMSSSAPKIYSKKGKETCTDGYYEAYRLWCSTKRP